MTLGPRNPGTKSKPVVLIVEDDADANSVIAGLVRLKGYVALKAHSAEDCIDKIHAHADQIDAVALNGFIAMEKGGMLISGIKKVNQNIKILAVAEEEGDRTSLIRMGADHVTIKPISAESIVDKITYLLSAAGTLTEAK